MLDPKIIQVASDLIRFQSVKNNYQEKKAIIQYVGKIFSKTDLVVRFFEKNKIPSLVITSNGNLHQDIFLNGHLDVVPAKEEDFFLKKNEEGFFGRGSGDMKMACAVMIAVMKNFSQKGKKKSLGLMLTTDEEIGGENGVGFLLKEKKFSANLAIIPDGGKGLNEIILNQKGVLHLKITTKGKSAHGAHPFLGKNAIEKIILIHNSLREFFPEIQQGEWKNTLNLGKINGGEAVNKVPDYAEMFLDIRYTEREHRELIIKKIQDLDCEFEIIGEGLPFIQKKHLQIDSFKKSIEKITEEKVLFSRVEGASDGRYFSEKEIPTVITKIKSKNIHGENEWVDEKEAVFFQKILIDFIENFK